MAIPNLANGWASTTAWSLDDVAVTVDVTSVAGIPARPFQAVILAEGANADEIVTVTDLTGSTVTITRAVEANAAGSAVASAHGANAIIAHVLTKATLTELVGAGVHTVADAGATETIDVSTASVWDITLTADCAITIAGSSAITWLGGGAPVLQKAASSTDVVTFMTQATAGEQPLTIYIHQDGTGGWVVTWANAGGGTVFYGAQVVPNTAGTAFPNSPATNSRFWRTDLGMEFYYDGTQWVSSQLFSRSKSTGDVAENTTTAGNWGRWGFHGATEVWLDTCWLELYVATTNTGSAYWTASVRKLTTAGASTSFGTVNTSADAADTILPKSIAIGAVLAVATYPWVDLAMTKTSSPGNLRITANLTYRLIAT
jgi:hypothetical protein